jgi:hypothetical protein
MVKKSTSAKAASKMLAPKKTAPRAPKSRGSGAASFEEPSLYLSKQNAITAKEILTAAKSKGREP